MPAMGTGYGNDDGTVSGRLRAYLARRARGGAGLIITEVCAVDPRGRAFGRQIGAWGDGFLPGLAALTGAIHQEGAKIALQLHHAGRETFAQAAGAVPEAPSAIPSPVLGQPCEAMSRERIASVVEAFARAAGRAQQAGFDAVELHGAHGYLLNQFLSPFSNSRSDEYGGSEENRARFVLEVLRAVRQTVGPAFPVILRISADELVRGGYDMACMQRLAPRLAAAGADALHCSVGVYATPGNLSVASLDTDPGFNLFRARAIREAAGVPVIGVGRISDPRMAEAALAAGDADLIAFGRQHLADPDFLAKAAAGDFAQIRTCVACNQGCIERLSFEMKSATCTFNPECGREHLGNPAPAEAGRRLWVIGAGPAGLSAALAAADRGYAVELFERDAVPGGQIRPAGQPPRKEALLAWLDWCLRQLDERGVPVRCGQEVTADEIRMGRPGALILATGADPAAPAIPGLDLPGVCDARALLTGRVAPAGPAVVMGAGYVGLETADFLAARGIGVTVLEMLPASPVGKYTAHGYWLHRRIREAGGRLLLGARVIRIEPEGVVFLQGDRQERLPAALVVTALGTRKNDGLAAALGETGIPWRVVGDAREPRRLLEAIHEGDRAGREI
jgi:2,4-dienoyl-CoA reductase-like NADH-dependent reductase (Old Yellow Enzyme family)